jgi:glyoxylase-like metal-dependent hydrolase (beta-lactamase superfamily II)
MAGRLTEVAPGVLVATSASFMLTTSTVVAAPGGGCLVIDPAVTVAELGALAAELAARGLRPRAGFATHPHWDHVLWHHALGNVPRYAAPRAAGVAERERGAMAADAGKSAPGHDPALFGRLVPLDPQAAQVGWDGPPAQVVIHDGHAPGHAAVFLPGTRTLVAGDMLSDVEIPLLDLAGPDPVGDYRAGLELLAALPDVRCVVPGHGHVGGAAEFGRRVAADLRYLDGLERGRPFGDARLTQDWLQRGHEAQLRFAAGR